MKFNDLTAEHIGAPVTVTVKGKPVSGTLVGFGSGSFDGKPPTEGRIDFYGGKSVTVAVDAEVTIES